MYSKKDVIERLRIVLIDTDLSQTEFGEKAGVTGAAISNYLKGVTTPSSYVIAGICEAYNVSADWLLLGRGPKYTRF